MFQICQNNPEFIKNLADKIINGEHIRFYPMRGIGKSSLGFYTNLIKEIFERINNEHK